jgi:hypothetical protein
VRLARYVCSQTISSAIPRRSFAARKERQSDGWAYRACDPDSVGRGASSGCASAPARLHSLDSTATAAVAPAARHRHGRPGFRPASVDQPEFVVQVAPNRVDVDEFNRWDAPLNDGIARAVAGDLIYLTTF